MSLLRVFEWAPLGTVVFRAHLFSAFCAAMACWVLFAFLRQTIMAQFDLSPRHTASAAGLSAIAYGLTPIVWDQAVEAEVYSLFALLFALALWLIPHLMRNPNAALPAIGFVAGLHIVHHRLAVFLLLSLGIVLLARTRWPVSLGYSASEHTNLLRWSSIGSSLPFLFLPLLWFLYFPLRAMNNPSINWYDPTSFERCYALIGGALYAPILQQGWLLWTQHFVLDRLLFLIALPFLCFSALSFVIIAGWIALFRRNASLGLFFALATACHVTFVMLYPVGDWPVFMLPALMLLTLPLAFGMAWILEALHSMELKTSIRRLAMGVMVAMAFLPLFISFDAEKGLLNQPLSKGPFPLSFNSALDRFAHDLSPTRYASRAWNVVPSGAPLLTGLNEPTADNELYPLLYQQVVEKRGYNSPLIGTGFLFLDWYREQINLAADLDLAATGDRRSESREAWLRDTLEEVTEPLLARGSIYSLSYPLPPEWSPYISVAIIDQVVVNRASVPYSYRRYIPRGYILRVDPKPAPEEAR